jgi:hypothetical protein
VAIDSKALEVEILKALGEHRMLIDDLMDLPSIRTVLETSVGPRHLWLNFLQITLQRMQDRRLIVEHRRVLREGWEKTGRRATRQQRRVISETGRCTWCARPALECICDDDPFLSEV